MATAFPFRGLKMFGNQIEEVVTQILNATGLFILKWLVLYQMNFISIKKQHLLLNCRTPSLSATGIGLQKLCGPTEGRFPPPDHRQPPKVMGEGLPQAPARGPRERWMGGSPQKKPQERGFTLQSAQNTSELPPGSLRASHLPLWEWQCCWHYPGPIPLQGAGLLGAANLILLSAFRPPCQ